MSEMFGKQIKYVAEVIEARTHPVDAGGSDDEIKKRVELAQQISRVVMQIIVSILIIGICFWLLINNSNEDILKASTGFIGLVIGYWLR